MKKMNLLSASFLLAAVFILASCSTSRTVERIDPSETIDLSGRWNDTDSRLVAEEMVNDALNRPWRTRFETRNNREPVIVVGLVRNRSHEHIASETFIRNIERSFINSGLIRLVVGGDARDELREERADQTEFASESSAARWAKELGADYIMQGTINSIVDSYRNRKTVTYQVNLSMTDIETNEIVWLGEKAIKKFIEN
ncbi:MAG: penicillin-binding protein activator LpoB [Chitinophagaceae bacterium]|nr:MAG: penicillin-binding protein activator LpoB [Chitinophagaceae bacterium]